MDILPNELLIEIFSQLDYESLTNCAQVCKTFKNVVDDEYFWDLWFRTVYSNLSRHTRHKTVRNILKHQNPWPRIKKKKKSSKYPKECFTQIGFYIRPFILK